MIFYIVCIKTISLLLMESLIKLLKMCTNLLLQVLRSHRSHKHNKHRGNNVIFIELTQQTWRYLQFFKKKRVPSHLVNHVGL